MISCQVLLPLAMTLVWKVLQGKGILVLHCLSVAVSDGPSSWKLLHEAESHSLTFAQDLSPH
jgi:hypothetical protein